MKSACYCGANGRSSTGASGARWFLGLARGNGIDQHERLGQIGGGQRRYGNSVRDLGEGQNAAAGGTDPTLVSGTRQLRLSLVRELGSLRRRGDRLRVVVVLHYGGGTVIMGLVRHLSRRLYLHRLLHCLVRGPWPAIEHRCRGKALQRQSQHHQAQQKAANTRHVVEILTPDLSSTEIDFSKVKLLGKVEFSSDESIALTLNFTPVVRSID